MIEDVELNDCMREIGQVKASDADKYINNSNILYTIQGILFDFS